MNETLVDWQWLAVEAKNGQFDGVFFFGVQTTGIFCRPSCSSRTPKRRNVAFFMTPNEAEMAGFRACLRCKPKQTLSPAPAAELVGRALEILKADVNDIPTVDDLASRLEVSAGHLQKTFKAVLGLSPKEVTDMVRIEKFKRNVRETDVTTSLYDSGFGSSRSLYEKAGETLGMTPATYKRGGKGTTIGYTIADSKLGKLLVAATEKGICAVSFGDDEESLLSELETEFFAAEVDRNDARLKDAVTAIVKSLDGEKAILTLPLDLRATAFQMRVWSELRKIPYGETRTYAQVAEAVGNPKAVRAVARACATNPVALVNPCHRVIGSDGKLAGYRWGIERKKVLLDGENR
ncbi:MAG TPA: bifunctional DNA-binding transcriptional regulator/O6-methylguanine-DNA methyltransferase Ada [Pyrinomonadaceae bacterium]|nr:bifunctional DNA-binding transcriptional regulator/O6-methylguanine-DNA methyltransferase Ada [Pyrinomonadaceae bacterium]